MQPPSVVAPDISSTISSAANGSATSALEFLSKGTSPSSSSPPSMLTNSINTSTSPVDAPQINPLWELNYLANVKEDKGKLCDGNEELHSVKDKLHFDLVTYSRFNCILENIRRSFDKGFTALQCVDQNKGCDCNEHLNLNLRHILHEAEMELALLKKQYDKLVYKFQVENGDSPISNGGSYDLSAAINFSTCSFLDSEKLCGTKASHLSNGHYLLNLGKEKSSTLPPLISPPPLSYDMAKRKEKEDNVDKRFNEDSLFKSVIEIKKGKIGNAKAIEESSNAESKEKNDSLEDDELMNRELSAIAKSVEKKKIECQKEEEGLKVANSEQQKKNSAGAADSGNGGIWECEWPDCTQLFDSEEILIQHRRCHIRKSSYLCKYCSARMLSRKELEQHVATCEQKNERKASFSKNRSSLDTKSNASSEEDKNLVVPDNGQSSSSGSEAENKAEKANKKSNLKRKDMAMRGHSSSDEEIEVDEVNRGDFGAEQAATCRSNAGSTETNAELLHPNKRRKAFSISTPSYMPAHHLASLSAFYPHLVSQNGINGLASSNLSPHHSLAGTCDSSFSCFPPGMNLLELKALIESGRISPLTLSMMTNQQNQHRFQQYFLQQQLQASASSSGGNLPSLPPSLPSENLTMPNLVRSSSFSSGGNVTSAVSSSGAVGLGSPFDINSNIIGLMGPNHTSGRIFSAALNLSQPPSPSNRMATSPGTLSGFGSHNPSSPSHSLFSPPGHSPTGLPRSHTNSAPDSLSALASLAAAAPSSPSTSSSSSSGVDRCASGHHGGLHFPLNDTGHLNSSPHSNGPKPFDSPIDLHYRSSTGSRHFSLGSPVSNGPGSVSSVPTSSAGQALHHCNLAFIYGEPSQPSGFNPHSLNGSSHMINNSTSSQGQLNSDARHAQSQLTGGLANGCASETSRLTAAALASLDALKPQSLGGTAVPVGEYKRTRYSGIGRYRCPWPDCGYTPHFLRDLRRHMFKHTGDKKHKCDYPGCDFISVWKTSLLQHQRKKHYGNSITLRSKNYRRGPPNGRRSPPPPGSSISL